MSSEPHVNYLYRFPDGKKLAVFYARYSTDRQNDRSIEDQFAVLEDYAAKEGFTVVARFEDRSLSGASMHARHGIRSLLRAARGGGFNVVLVETTSRLGRDREDRAHIYKRLTFAGIKIMTPAEGVVTDLIDGIRAVVDSQQLTDLKGQIRRGMKGVVRDGRHAGGKPYGYRAVPGQPGELIINAAEAEVVRSIFERFVGGEIPRDIAHYLNSNRVPPPRGAIWRASSIGGDKARQFGILRNRVYIGKNVWNRGRYDHDPDTGARVRRANPESEWLVTDMPHLRIVSDEMFEAAQRRLADRAKAFSHHTKHRPRRVLSGLLRCGVCGGGMSIKDYDGGRPRLVCTNRREGGDVACHHRRNYYADEVERMVINGLREDLGSRETIGIFIRAYNDEKQRVASGGEATQLESRLASVDRQIDRAVAAVIEDRITKEEADRHLPALRAEREAIKSQLAALGQPPKVVALRPSAVETYLRDIENLSELVNGDLTEGDSGAAKALRSMIETVTVMPTLAGGPPGLKVDGHLAGLLDLDSNALHSGGDGGAG